MNDLEFSKQYLEILNSDFSGLNLTAYKSLEEIHLLQTEDALKAASISPIFSKLIKDNPIVDVGFGGGFPILPLASQFPKTQFRGFEARQKKSIAVNQIAQKMGLDNVKTFHQRYEVVLWDRPCLVTFKAVSKVEQLLSQFKLATQIHVAFYKGPQFHQLESLEKIKKTWELIEESAYSLSDGQERVLLIFKPKVVPRGTNNQSDLVKLSHFL